MDVASYPKTNPYSPPSANSVRRISIPAVVILGVVCWVVLALAAPLVSHIYQARRFYGHVDRVVGTIRSFHSRRPSDVPEDQWKEAVDWTANVICQDFYEPNPQELPGLEELSQQLDETAKGEVDLGTLRWIWDECEDRCGGPESCGIRFRNVKLLTKGTITDTRLPDVWSLSRCTNLDLIGTEITDASVPYLATLTQLERLDIRDSQVSDKGAEGLRKALPKCQVLH